MQKKKQKQCNGNHFLDLSLSSLMGIWNASTFTEWIWVSLIEFDPIQVLWVRSDPIRVLWVRSDPIQILWVQSDPIQVLWVRSDPIQVLSVRSDPIRSGPIRILSTAQNLALQVHGRFEWSRVKFDKWFSETCRQYHHQIFFFYTYSS